MKQLVAGVLTALALAAAPMAQAQTPPGVLVVGQNDEPKSLDPHAVTAVNDFRILMNVYDGLVRYKDGTLEVEPALATGWEISEDGTTYTFDLRREVNFHDGTPLTAEVFKFNFDRMLNEDHPYHFVRDGIVVIPKNTIIPDRTYIGPEGAQPEEKSDSDWG